MQSIQSENLSWQIVEKVEKFTGVWPCQNRVKKYLLRIFYTVYGLFLIFGLLAKLYEGSDLDIAIRVENVLSVLLCSTIISKHVFTWIYETQRKKMYLAVIEEWKQLKDAEEAKMLQTYSKAGLKIILTYQIVLLMFLSVYHSFPFVDMILVRLRKENLTLYEKQLSLHVEFYINQQKYYYLLLFYTLGYGLFGTAVVFAHDLAWVMSVQHTCALFEIVKIRLDKASSALEQVEDGILDRTIADRIAYNHVVTAAKMHKLALRKVDQLEHNYNVSWFIVLLQSSFGFGGVTFIIFVTLHKPFTALRYFSIFCAVLLHYFFVDYEGQKIIDHSSEIFEACYNSDWYNYPKEVNTLIRIMMLRSLKCNQLTGTGLIVLSMESFAMMLKAALSYFSVFAVIFKDYAVI